MKIFPVFAFAAALIFNIASPGTSHAQRSPKVKSPSNEATPSPTPTPQAEAAPATLLPPGWMARCSSASRDAPLECAIEQSAVLTKTGQLVVLVNVRVAGDSRAPIAFIQLPLGLNLPVGAKLQVDDGKAADLQIQSCEQRGCYANTPIAPDLLAAMKAGKQLKVSFQNLGKETISVPIPLTDFASAYDKIK